MTAPTGMKLVFWGGGPAWTRKQKQRLSVPPVMGAAKPSTEAGSLGAGAPGSEEMNNMKLHMCAVLEFLNICLPHIRHTQCSLSFRGCTKDKHIVCLKFPEQPHIWVLVLLVQRNKVKCSCVWFLRITWEDVQRTLRRIYWGSTSRHTSYKQCQISTCKKHKGTMSGSL